MWSLLLKIFHKGSQVNEFIVDSFPIPTIKNIRISGSKKYIGRQYRGYNATKKLLWLQKEDRMQKKLT